MRLHHAIPLLVTCVALATEAAAQSATSRGYLFREPPAALTVFGGFGQPGANSQLFDFTFDELTLGRGDFAGFDRGVDFAIRLNQRTDLVLGVAVSGSSRRSEFRDFVDNNDRPIEQTTSFTRVPLGASLRYHFVPRGRMIGSRAWIPARLVPWVGVGGGMLQYRFQQQGDFIDFDTADVFFDRFTTRGWAPFFQGSLGAAWTLIPNLQLVGEARYVGARGETGGDFEGFDKIDLSGMSTLVGITLRF